MQKSRKSVVHNSTRPYTGTLSAVKWQISSCQGMIWQTGKIFCSLFKETHPYSGTVTTPTSLLDTCCKLPWLICCSQWSYTVNFFLPSCDPDPPIIMPWQELWRSPSMSRNKTEQTLTLEELTALAWILGSYNQHSWVLSIYSKDNLFYPVWNLLTVYMSHEASRRSHPGHR